jgi:P27 family predicted phage terminase small subunit
MGKRGPAPKATNLKILEGNPGKRPLNSNEPQPETGATCPDWLSDNAQLFWAELYPVLESCGIITKADQYTLAAYCDALANYKRATVEIEELESLIEKNGHGSKMSPVVTAQRNYAELMIKYGTKLGLSPSDRTSLKVSPTKKQSKWQDKISA